MWDLTHWAAWQKHLNPEPADLFVPGGGHVEMPCGAHSAAWDDLCGTTLTVLGAPLPTLQNRPRETHRQ